MEQTIEVCKSVAYINRIDRNLQRIKKKDIKKLLEASQKCRRIILAAEGRSLSSLFIGIKGTERRIFAITDSSFPWRNIREAATELQKRRGKTVLLINSGGGESTMPKEMAKDLRNWINETHSRKFLICTVTSNPKSKIAKLSDIVVVLKGRTETESKAKHTDVGIMGDLYELASMVLFQMIKKAVNNALSAKDVLAEMKKEMKTVGHLIDNYLASGHYKNLLKETTSRAVIVFGGLGPGREVAEMTAIRTFHIKRLVRGEVFLTGPLAPPPKPGDVLILISFSGETVTVLKWCSDYRKAGGIIFSIVGRNSSLYRKSRSFILEGPLEEFYKRAVFLLSPLPGGVMEELKKRGTVIPESMLRIFGHSKTG